MCLWATRLRKVLSSRTFSLPGEVGNISAVHGRSALLYALTGDPAVRTCLLVMIVLALNGVFILEQPALSWFEYFPRFRDLCKKMKFWKVSWYMWHYGAPTPKRHFAYSNSPCIRSFSRGKLRGWKKKVRPGAPKSAYYYKDAKGKKRYVGTKFLKGTGSGA